MPEADDPAVLVRQHQVRLGETTALEHLAHRRLHRFAFGLHLTGQSLTGADARMARELWQ